jgi:hypothetical protein
MISIRDTLLLSIGLLILLHLPIVWVRSSVRGRQWHAIHEVEWKKYWEGSDYVWLLFSLLGVLSLAGDASRVLSQNQLNLRAQYLGYERDRFYVERVLDWLGQLPREEPGYVQAGEWLYDAQEVAEAANERIATAQSLFENEKADEAAEVLREAQTLYEEFLVRRSSSLPELPFSDDAPNIVANFQENLAYVNELLMLYEGTRRAEPETTFFFLSPLLLAIAVAIRIAKVTAKVFVDFEKPSDSSASEAGTG